jgi:hypothetical protein
MYLTQHIEKNRLEKGKEGNGVIVEGRKTKQFPRQT